MSAPEHHRLIAWHRELIAAHERLRAALRLAQGSVGNQLQRGRDLLLYCLGFCTALGGHHLSEDANPFPELSARHPELRETITTLTQDLLSMSSAERSCSVSRFIPARPEAFSSDGGDVALNAALPSRRAVSPLGT